MEQWDVALNQGMFSYNTSVHNSTGITLQFLMFGEEGRVPSEVIISIPPLEQTTSAYTFRRFKQLSLAYDAAREETASVKHLAKDYYDTGALH